MTVHVVAYTSFEGFHRWPEATGYVGFLADRHRHVFHLRCWWPVKHDNRDVEFIKAGRAVRDFVKSKWGEPAELGNASCEHVCQAVLARFPEISKVSCYEDDENGAEVSRD